MESSKTLNILQWNAQGITTFASQTQLSQLLQQEKSDIVLLSETLLKEQHKFYLSGYRIHRNDRNNDRGGGVAIAVKSNIKHDLLPITKTSCIENISIKVSLNGKNATFTSIYCPKYQQGFEKDIKILTKTNGDHFIGGDFNAHNSAWNCVKNNKAGNILNNLQLNSNSFIYFPNSPTHYPNSGATPSTI